MRVALVIELQPFADVDYLAELMKEFVLHNTMLVKKADLLEVRCSDHNPQNEIRLTRVVKHIL